MTKPVALAIKWVLIALAIAGLFYIATQLALAGNVIAVVVAGFVGMGILAVYATRRAVPLKYLVPGLLLMVAFQLWPVVFTASLSLSNYGDGHLNTKQESTKDIIAQSVREVPNTPRYSDVRRGQGRQARRHGRPLPLADPARRHVLRRQPRRPRAARRRGPAEDARRQDHRCRGLHHPQRARDQQPQRRPRQARRPDDRWWRDQARRPVGGLRGQGERQLRRGQRPAHRHLVGPAGRIRPQGRPLGQRRQPGPGLPAGMEGERWLRQLHPDLHRPDHPVRLLQHLRLEHRLRRRLRAVDVPARACSSPCSSTTRSCAARASTGRC